MKTFFFHTHFSNIVYKLKKKMQYRLVHEVVLSKLFLYSFNKILQKFREKKQLLSSIKNVRSFSVVFLFVFELVLISETLSGCPLII